LYVSGPAEPVTPDAQVNAAGTQPTRGLYAYVGSGTWQKGQYIIAKESGYPTPGVDQLAIMSGSNIYYYAPFTEFPWDVTWQVGSFGTAPAPTVVKV
jgi:hypothetical protein